LKHEVVVAGGGFAGLWVSRALGRAGFDVTVIDQDNYHTFLPLLYQVAAAELEPEAIAYPLRHILRRDPRVSFFMAEVTGLDADSHVLRTSRGDVSYETIVLALGSVTRYFGIPGAEQFAFPLKTVDQGIVLRNHILCCFERAEQECDPDTRRKLLTFVTVGGGATGVEFTGALAELVRRPIAKDYRNLDPRSDVQLVLLEGDEQLLSGLPRKLQDYTQRRLEKMGASVRLLSRVTQVTGDGVYLEDGTGISTKTVVWTAGVQGSALESGGQLPMSSDRRVLVEPTLQVTGYPNVYVIGDMARIDRSDEQLPLTAPVAVQQATKAAENIQRQRDGADTQPFSYRDRGAMATIGRNAAVATPFGRAFIGFPAWLLWLVFHLAKLIGFRNRLVVLLNWAWDYLFFERVVRLILPRGIDSQRDLDDCG